MCLLSLKNNLEVNLSPIFSLSNDCDFFLLIVFFGSKVFPAAESHKFRLNSTVTFSEEPMFVS